MKILVLASLAYSLTNFRGALLRRMAAEGHDVVACAPDEDAEVTRELAGMGVRFRSVSMSRTGLNPFRDLATLFQLRRIIRDEAPYAVLAYTQKPIIYGGIAARLTRKPRFVAMVSGLGHAFSEGGGLKRLLLRGLVSLLYRAAVARAAAVLVFNKDDAGELQRHGILRAQPVIQIPGSGVDLQRFPYRPVPEGPPIFLLVARLMRDKGLAEFVTAARIVRSRYPDARFQILGPQDPNPTGIGQAELDAWVRSGSIEYLGETRDVAPFLAAASVFVLPTYYREGLPRTILEAMATGRAIITTDMPGCRETVEPGENGFLVAPRDSEALAEAMLRFAEQPALARIMGDRSRSLAAEKFEVSRTNDLVIAAVTGQSEHRPRRRALQDRPIFEGTAALILAIVSLPLMGLIAAAVWLAMGRPILHVQRRAGVGGLPFALVKFRTMRDTRDGAGRLLPDDRRVTGLGRLLRRTRFDELPELWNILAREMSLIGPRPLLPETVAAMGSPGMARCSVRPGLTGWAQVNGNALLTDADKLSLDLWYIENRSLWLDLRIAAQTLWTVLHGERLNPAQIEKAYARTAHRCG